MEDLHEAKLWSQQRKFSLWCFETRNLDFKNHLKRVSSFKKFDQKRIAFEMFAWARNRSIKIILNYVGKSINFCQTQKIAQNFYNFSYIFYTESSEAKIFSTPKKSTCQNPIEKRCLDLKHFLFELFNSFTQHSW